MPIATRATMRTGEFTVAPSYHYPKFQRKFTVKVGSSTSGNAT